MLLKMAKTSIFLLLIVLQLQSSWAIEWPSNTPGIGYPSNTPGIGYPSDTPGIGYPSDTSGIGFPSDTSGIGFPSDTSGIGFPSDTSGIGYPSDTPVQPMDPSSQPSQQQAVTEVVSNFSQITQTYSYITQSFQNTSQALFSEQDSMEETKSILVQFQSNLSQVVQGISGGCQCGADGVNTTHLQSMVTTWFVNLQYMVRVVQIRHPNDYQTTFSEVFVSISLHMQVSLGVAYSAGVNVDNLCQNAMARGGINASVLSKVNIQTDRFVRISEAVTTQAGVFSRIPPPVGHRFPSRRPPKNSILRPPSWGIKLPQPIFANAPWKGFRNPPGNSDAFFNRFWKKFQGFPSKTSGRPNLGARVGQPFQ